MSTKSPSAKKPATKKLPAKKPTTKKASAENPPARRTYQKKARARQEQQTRERIVEAVAELHQRVGPAQTTISEVASRAGVGRMTVYKHFPEEFELFAACGAHWSSQHPLPDFSDCLALTSLAARCRGVLERLYTYYRANQAMLGNVLRDARSLPDLQKVVELSWYPEMRGLEQALLPPGLSAPRRQQLRATLRLVLDFQSWEILAGELTDEQAARTASTLVVAANKPLPR